MATHIDVAASPSEARPGRATLASANVLLTCAGRRNYLVEYFRSALRGRGLVYAADVSPDAPALQVADQAFIAPSITDTHYVDFLLDLCRHHQVRLLISLNDLELPLLATQRERFLERGTIPVVSSPHVVNVCFDKWLTREFLKALGLAFPRTYLTLKEAQRALATGAVGFPLMIKPRWGTASIGIQSAEDDEELELAYRFLRKKLQRTILAQVSRTDEKQSVLIQERLAGQEYGLDVINDLEGRYVTTLVKRKLSMRAGETDQAVTVYDERLQKLGSTIGRELKHVGNLDCDVFVTSEDCYVLEMNPRFGGGYPFSHVAGANLPAMLLAWVDGGTTEAAWQNVASGVRAAKSHRLHVLRDIADVHSPHALMPMSSPDLTETERETVERVLTTPVLSIGPQLEAFEREVAAYIGAASSIGVNSGTSALHLSVIAAGVTESDLVMADPFSFVASANCILYERACPVFVDVDLDTGNMDPALVTEAVRDLVHGGPARNHWLPPSLRRTRSTAKHSLRAILPVHTFGQPADMDPITAVARDHGLSVIEDACEAIGAEYKGRKAGTLGEVGVFAFYPNKQMTTGEGGMIVTDNPEWNNLCRSLRNQGRDVYDGWLHHTRLGYNYRLDEMSAALGLVQIRRIEELLNKRARVAEWYNDRLEGVELIVRPRVAPTTTRMSWFLYVIRIKPPADRRSVMHRLADAGIPSRPYFSPIHLQPFYQQRFGYRRGDFPVAEYLGDVSLALPFSGVMTEGQVDEVCRALNRALHRESVRQSRSRPVESVTRRAVET